MRLGRSEIKFFLVVVMIIAALAGALISNDLKDAYVKIEPVDSGAGNTLGVMASDDTTLIPVVTNLEELESAKTKFVLEVDADKIEKTGIVIEPESTYTSFPGNTDFFRKLLFIYSEKITAQNYIVALDDGNKIIVSLCDIAYEVPSEGRVKLPIGELKKYKSLSNEDKYQELGVSKEYSSAKVDCYSSLGVLDEIREANKKATARSVIIIAAAFIFSSVVLIVTSIRGRRKGA